MKWPIFIILIGYVSCIDLSEGGLSDVPSNISFNESLVNLAKNKITVIRENAFVILIELEALELSNNKIGVIEPGAFNGLVKLTYLSLWGNRLKAVPDKSILVTLVSLQSLYLGYNPYKLVDTTQLVVLSNLYEVSLNWIHPAEDFPPFLSMPNLRFVNFDGNWMRTFSRQILKELSGVRSILLGYNKFSSLPDLGGVEGQIQRLGLRRNRFVSIPNLRKYTNLEYLDLSDNYITLVPEQSLSHIQRGDVNLKGNPVICVSELCWLVAGSWPFKVHLTCSDGTPWEDVDRAVICEGTTFQWTNQGPNKIIGICRPHFEMCFMNNFLWSLWQQFFFGSGSELNWFALHFSRVINFGSSQYSFITRYVQTLGRIIVKHCLLITT